MLNSFDVYYKFALIGYRYRYRYYILVIVLYSQLYTRTIEYAAGVKWLGTFL